MLEFQNREALASYTYSIRVTLSYSSHCLTAWSSLASPVDKPLSISLLNRARNAVKLKNRRKREYGQDEMPTIIQLSMRFLSRAEWAEQRHKVLIWCLHGQAKSGNFYTLSDLSYSAATFSNTKNCTDHIKPKHSIIAPKEYLKFKYFKF